MLVALLALLFLGGHHVTSPLLKDIHHLHDRVKTAMPAGDQRSEALRVVKSIEKTDKEHGKSVSRSAKHMRRALKHHDTSIADVDPIWDDYMQGIETYNRDMIDLRFKLREHVTREEWGKIFPRT